MAFREQCGFVQTTRSNIEAKNVLREIQWRRSLFYGQKNKRKTSLCCDADFESHFRVHHTLGHSFSVNDFIENM